VYAKGAFAVQGSSWNKGEGRESKHGCNELNLPWNLLWTLPTFAA